MSIDTLSGRLATLTPEQRARLLAELRERRSDNQPFGLSRSQWVMWFLNQIEPTSAAYNVAFALALRIPVDTTALRRAFERLVARHEALRTLYRVESNGPVQQVAVEAVLDFQHMDATGLSETELEARMRAEYERPFDLEHGPVLRVVLFHRARTESALLLAAHHVALDLSSITVLLDELRVVYAAECAGRPLALPRVKRQFRDFARWQVTMLEGPRGEQLWEYWRQRLADRPSPLGLPTDYPRPAAQRLRGATHHFTLSHELTRQLRELARAEGATLYSTLLAAFQTLLHRYSGQEDILVGSPMTGRTRAEFARVVGCLTNFIILRSRPSGDVGFRRFLSQVVATVHEAMAHQDYPLGLLTERLQVAHDPSRRPLTDVGFCLEQGLLAPADPASPHEPGGLELEVLPFLAQQEGQFDLYLEMVEVDGALTGALRYSTDLFAPATIERLAANFDQLLSGIVADPDCALGELPLLSAAEARMLEQWNSTDALFPADRTFIELFEEQVAREPRRIALVCGDQRLSYAELDGRANAIGQRLITAGVERGDVVGILAERGIDWLVGMLGVFKSGAIYLPLDPRHPDTRLAQVLGRSGARVVLAQSRQVDKVAARALPLEADDPCELATRSGSPDDLAYVIYTSGSTGTPKGALVEQRGMLNHLFAKIADLGIGPSDRVAQTASQCFDISVWQALVALLVGGQTHIFVDEIAHNPARLLSQVERHGITILETVPSLMRVMVEVAAETPPARRPALESLRWLIPTGEVLPLELCREWFEIYPGVPLLNAYGPTECSDDVTHAPIHAAPAADMVRVPIGKPIANMRLHVLDDARRQLPIGVVGELFVAGVGVGRGYLNEPERTREAFLTDPFSADPGARLYRTGDLGRWRADGMLEYVGRVDHQVKLRGFRVELGEIEAVLRQHPAVAEVAVLAREDTPGRKQLVAYVQPAAGHPAPTSRELRQYLAARLPAYMVPAAVVSVPKLPLTANGKVDRRALPAPTREASAPRVAVAPRTETEARLAAIWSGVLDVREIGIHDNFFELGGTSILGMQVIARAAEAGLAFTTRDLYASPTIAELAAVAQPAVASAEQSQVALTPTQQRIADGLRASGAEDVYPLAPMQAGILFQTLLSPDAGAYVLQFVCELAYEGPRLRERWQSAVDRHPVLRTSFRWENLDAPVQVVEAAASVPYVEYDWRMLSPQRQQEQRAEFLAVDRARGFGLEHAPLMRLCVLRTRDDAAWLVLSIHHLVLDGWSLARLLGEVFGEAQVEVGRPYRDFVAWLQ
ncbi:MAG: amino acid adenylation domain-containing protein, partial [Chloroflexota bacterium]|nr:amino acid adenylation domain-containing protein [Chloroflexota bacterium]